MKKAQGIYMISVAAEILEMHPQTLRKYERAGFVEPPRTGMLRLYSDEDIVRLRLIKHFVEELGLNLAGVQLALNQANKLLRLRGHLAAQKHPSGAVTEAIQQIDDMLKDDLALQVVQESDFVGNRELPPPQGIVFQVLPVGAIEFAIPKKQAID